MLIRSRFLWWWGFFLLVFLQAEGQPFFRPTFTDSVLYDRFHRKYEAGLEYGCTPAAEQEIKQLCQATQQDPDPSLHTFFSLHAAEFWLRKNDLTTAFLITDYLLQRQPIPELPPQQAADLLMVLGDIAYELRTTSSRTHALKAYNAARSLLPLISLATAVVQRKRAMTLRMLHDYLQAEEAFEHSLLLIDELRLRLGHSPYLYRGLIREEIRSLQERGIFHFKCADKDPAYTDPTIVDFQSARQLIDHPGSHPWGSDKILQSFYEGEIQRDFFNNGENALRHFLDAVAIPWESYSYYIVYCYERIGGIYFEQGDFNQAKKAYDRQVHYLEANSEEADRLVRAYEHLGNCYYNMSDMRQAEQYFKIGLNRLAERGSEAKTMASFLFNYGLVLIENEDFEQARSYMEKALASFKASPNPDNVKIATCYLNIGLADLRQKRWQAGIHNFNAAVKLLPLQNQQGSRSLAFLYACLNDAYYNAGQLDSAAYYYRLTQNTVASIPDQGSNVTKAAIMIGDYLVAESQPEAAIRIYHREMQRLVEGFSTNNLLALPDFNNARSPWHILRATQHKASAFWLKYTLQCDPSDLEASLRHYMASMQLVRRYRLERYNLDSKLQMASDNRSVFDEGIAVAAAAYDLTAHPAARDSAFKICEQSKGMILMEALLASRAQKSAGISESALQAKDTLEQEISRLQTALMGTHSNTQVSVLNERLFQAQNKLRQLTDQLRLLNPRFFGPLYEAGEVNIPALQHRLHRDRAAVLEYMLTADALYTFVITADTFLFLHTQLPELFNCQLTEFSERMRRAPDIHDDPMEFCIMSYEIYKVLVGNIPIPLPQRLIIIPDGNLNYLPFDALVRTPCHPDLYNYAQIDYLVDTKVISYQYSAAYMLQDTVKPLRDPAKVLVMAPTFSGHKDLTQLPFAREGVVSLSSNYQNIKPLLDQEATPDAFKRLAGHYDILDLATHAIVDSLDPMKSRLYFTGDSAQGWIYQQEIFSMKLNARLAVLEACETGTGHYSKGEGVMSLARGFSYAGCKGILMSLWYVSDLQIRAILERFYQDVALGHPIDRALAQAKRAFIANLKQQGGRELRFAHPSFWAELVLIGDYSPIPLAPHTFGTKYSWLLPTLGITFILICILVLIRYRKKLFARQTAKH